MEKIKVRYTWKWHTMIKLNGEEIKVLEMGVLDVPSDQKIYFISNWFEQVWWKSESEITAQIDSLETDCKTDRQVLEQDIKKIEAKMFAEINEIQKLFDNRENERQAKIERLKADLKQVKEDEDLIEKDIEAQIEQLSKMVKKTKKK